MLLRRAVSRAVAPISRSSAAPTPFSSSLPRLLHTSSPRSDASSTPVKPSVKLISQIRNSNPGVTLSLARSALLATNNSLPDALQWIADQSASMGAAKAKKLEGRAATEGLVGVALLADGLGGAGVRAAMVELSCETSFVARTNEFEDLLESITRSLAFFAEPSAGDATSVFTKHDPTSLADVPLVPPPSQKSPPTPMSTTTLPTVSSSILSAITKLGENITLRRALSISLNPLLPDPNATSLASTYIHGSRPSSSGDPSYQSGSLASLVILNLPPSPSQKSTKDSVKGLARALARQIVAQPTSTVRGTSGGDGVSEESKALYEQPLITMASSQDFEFESGSSVAKVLKLWSESKGVEGEGLQVIELERWEVGASEE